jgi:hypothetical protein
VDYARKTRNQVEDGDKADNRACDYGVEAVASCLKFVVYLQPGPKIDVHSLAIGVGLETSLAQFSSYARLLHTTCDIMSAGGHAPTKSRKTYQTES